MQNQTLHDLKKILPRIYADDADKEEQDF